MASSTSSALWRLYRAPYGPGLDGIGGTFANGRWHKRGELVVYFGASASIVVLERLAHIDADLLPGDLRLGRFEFAASVSINNVNDLAALPDDWTRNETFTRNLGSEWLRTPSACVLAVPSATLPEESNFVLNPRHPDAQGLVLRQERPFTFDTRLI